MKPSLNGCPVCGEELVVERYRCVSCDTQIEGRFGNSALPGLNPAQMEFVRTFVLCEGKINRMETELGISYPTIRNRLRDVIRAMGFEPKGEETGISAEKRQALLKDLESGKISANDAMQLLQAGEEQ